MSNNKMRLTREELDELVKEVYGHKTVGGYEKKEHYIIQTEDDLRDFLEAFPDNTIQINDKCEELPKGL